MDEEPKPFPIEFIVILLIIAIANDIAEVCFDLLDFTGVGLAGEGIMEPINLVLDFFFTGVFVWRLGFGGGTLTQYIANLLEPFFVPARTISVGIGMWVANHPKSALSKATTQVTSLESGSVGAVDEIEDAAKTAEKNAAGAVSSESGGSVQQEGVTSGGANAPESQEESASGSTKKTNSRPSESGETGAGEDNGEGGDQVNTPSATPRDELASPEEGDPMARVKEGIQGSEAVGFEARPKPTSNENDQPEKVVDIRSRPKSGNKDLPKAA